MTVATVVAGLLPLLWLTRTGAEFMKPWPRRYWGEW